MSKILFWINEVPHNLLKLFGLRESASHVTVEYFFFVDSYLKRSIYLRRLQQYAMNTIGKSGQQFLGKVGPAQHPATPGTIFDTNNRFHMRRLQLHLCSEVA
jgi:hypothetical protein